MASIQNSSPSMYYYNLFCSCHLEGEKRAYADIFVIVHQKAIQVIFTHYLGDAITPLPREFRDVEPYQCVYDMNMQQYKLGPTLFPTTLGVRQIEKVFEAPIKQSTCLVPAREAPVYSAVNQEFPHVTEVKVSRILPRRDTQEYSQLLSTRRLIEDVMLNILRSHFPNLSMRPTEQPNLWV